MTSTTVLAQAALDNAVVPPLWGLLTKFAYFAGLAAVMGSTIVHARVLRPAPAEPGVDADDRAALNRRSALIMAWSGVILLAALYPQLAGKARQQ
jgi:copper transport protein